MTFKEFIRLSEQGTGSDNGLMGLPVPSSVRKPSDGQPFKNLLGPASGQTPRGGGGGGGAGAPPMGAPMGAAMMKKKMKKK